MIRPLLAFVAAATLTSAAQANLRLFDNGTGSKQVATDGEYTYILKETGQIWRHAFGQFQQIDDGANTRMIAAADKRCYVLKESGAIWMYDQTRWSQVDDGRGTKQIVASGGRLYALKNEGQIYRRSVFTGNWQQIDNGTGTRMIYAHQHVLWILKENNHTWRYDDQSGQFRQISQGNVSHTQDIVGDTRFVYMLKGDGKVWRWQPSQRPQGRFDRLGQGSKHFKLSLDHRALNVLTRRGNVWRWDRNYSGWKKIPVQRGTRDLVSRDGRMLLLTAEGQVLSWSDSPWAPQTAKFETLHQRID